MTGSMAQGGLTAVMLGASLGSGAAALAVPAWPRAALRASFGLLALSAVAGIAVTVLALSGAGEPVRWQLPLGLPWLPWHLRVDPLAGFLLGVIGVVVLAVALFGPGYLRAYRHRPYPVGLLGLATGLFVAGMQLVVLADDAFVFMVAWELMSVASYFLVAFEHHEGSNRRAALLYLLMAQVGGLLILLAFGVLAAFGHGFSFDALRAASLPMPWRHAAFTLALVGFGMKAGLVPLHVWLPEAHPAAPSHVSALMSGVMLKVAVYGFVRVVFDLMGGPSWEWGVVLLVAGSVTALYGVLYALMQHDLKRLLAYHSVENIGIIYIGLGLAAIFFGAGHPGLGVVGLIAALFHTLNHALFKSLLFLGAGTVLERAHERDLERMGGLLRRLPWTGGLFLVGCLSISALPPFNGFASEWLTFQAALQATALDSGVLRTLIPVSAAMLALTGALAAACFVKVYGVAFLGLPRTRHAGRAREAGFGMIAGQGWLAALCVVFGVLPTVVVAGLNRVVAGLTGHSASHVTASGWLWLTPVARNVASYSAPLAVAVTALVVLIGFAVVALRRGGAPAAPRRAPAWDCGFGRLTHRMQYSATAFAMPIREVFRPAFRLREERLSAAPATPRHAGAQRQRYALHVDDIAWGWLYQPLERLVHAAARRVSRIQTGQIRHYLAYSFFTLLVLLWVIS